jgi:signal transduction histidine kinase
VPRGTHLRALVRSAWSAVSGDAARKTAALRVAGDATAIVDRERMEQVFINLFDNALRHSPAGADVGVRIARTQRSVSVTVRDRGRGFSKRAAHALGTPFAPSPDGRLGLGLSIARLLVEAHGGTLSLERAAGHGACLRIRLPATPPHG